MKSELARLCVERRDLIKSLFIHLVVLNYEVNLFVTLFYEWHINTI